MSTPTPTPSVPSFAETLTHSLAQKLATMAVTALAGYGLVQTDQTAQDTTLVASAILFVASIAWTYIRTRIDTNRNKALATAAGVPTKGS